MERVLSPPDTTNLVLWCYPRLTVKEVHTAFRSNTRVSLWVTCRPHPTQEPQTWLFHSYFYSCFHLHTSYNSAGCAIYSTCEGICFIMARTGWYTLFLLPHDKNDIVFLLTMHCECQECVSSMYSPDICQEDP